MAERWTDEQLKVMAAVDGNVLVGAAAGSGKTTVMSERIARIVCDKERKMDPSRLLVLTFSKAAAAEMRKKIRASVSAKLTQNPGDPFLKKQYKALGRAQISTVHSFCNSILREHFSEADIAPDFTLVDDTYMISLSKKAVETTAEKSYELFPGDVRKLSDSFGQSRRDSEVFDAAVKLSDFKRNIALPHIWQREAEEMTFVDKDTLCSIPAAVYAFGYIGALAREGLKLAEKSVMLNSENEQSNKNEKMAESDLAYCKDIIECCEQKNWERIQLLSSGMQFERRTKVKDDDLQRQLTLSHDFLKDRLNKKIKEFFSLTLEEAVMYENKGIEYGKALLRITDIYEAELDALKKERRVIDYNDLEILTLGLLYDKEGVRTELAEHISSCYDYICVDEFQDTNGRQELIFNAVAGDDNSLFCVGDVKQSIYAFRNADCRIFTAMKDRYEKNSEGYPMYLALHKNFRSTRQVIDAVNRVFSPLMTREVGGIDYEGGEELVKGEIEGQVQPDEATGLEYHLMCGERDVLPDAVASYIDGLIKERYPVYSGSTSRPVRPEDICILLSVAKNIAPAYQEALAARKIPSSSSSSENFFDTSEIMTILALLHIIDNPLRNVDLAAVMVSPLFKFTEDELARLRVGGKREYIWKQVLTSGDGKCVTFRETIQRLRHECAVMNIAETVEHVITETDAELLLTAPPDTKRRKAKLRAFIDYAASYSPVESRDLGDFLRVCDNCARDGKGPDVDCAGEPGVTITTVHKSKGLEWPVVIFADGAHEFNLTDGNADHVFASEELGIGVKIKVQGPEGSYNVESPTREAMKLMNKAEGISEKMRLFYVALTRAKQKAVFYASVKGDESGRYKAFSDAEGLIADGRLLKSAVPDVNDLSKWMNMVFAVNGFTADDLLEDEKTVGSLKLVAAEKEVFAESETAADGPDEEQVKALLDEIERRLSFTYPDEALTRISTKVAVTDIAEGHGEKSYISRPAFARAGELTAAEKGTALHRFMQLCDYRNAADDPEKEIERLGDELYMDKLSLSAVKADKVRNFFASDLGIRILDAKKVLREYAFIDTIDSAMIDAGTSGEKILIQGIADCVILEEDGAVLVDYKTDRVKEADELVQRYSGQLKLYRTSLEKRLGVPVKECIIWSFALDKEISI